jgi:hypothetical protein
MSKGKTQQIFMADFAIIVAIDRMRCGAQKQFKMTVASSTRSIEAKYTDILNCCSIFFCRVLGLKETVKEYWWAILLGIIGCILIVALLVFVCVRYTPSSNPIREQKRPAKKVPGRKKKNQDRMQDANAGARHSPTMEMEHEV